MDLFIQKYRKKVIGILSGFDAAGIDGNSEGHILRGRHEELSLRHGGASEGF